MSEICTRLSKQDIARISDIQNIYTELMGSGTVVDPYKIGNIYELQSLICADEKEHSILVDDIDAKITEQWNRVERYSEIFEKEDMVGNFGFELDLDNITEVIDVYTLNPDDECEQVDYSFDNKYTITIDEDFDSRIAIDYTIDEDHYMGFRPIGNIQGVIDGNGYTISGLYINRPFKSHVGFTNQVVGGEIKNLTLTDVTIHGDRNVGSITGVTGYYTSSLPAGQITNCSSDGAVTGDGWIGGLTGKFYKGDIRQSSFNGSVEGCVGVGGLVGWSSNQLNQSYFIGSIKGDCNVGGLVGLNRGYIKNSYARGYISNSMVWRVINKVWKKKDIIGNRTVGGLVGLNRGYIKNSYTTLKANHNCGLSGFLVGLNMRDEEDEGILHNVYWEDYKANENAVNGSEDYLTNSTRTQDVVQSLSTNDMKNTDFYGFDFENVWTTEDGEYPKLQWQE